MRYWSTGSNIMLCTTNIGSQEHFVQVHTSAFPALCHSYLGYLIFQVRQFLDSFKGDGELQRFMTSFSETAMFAEVVRAKAKSMRKQITSPSHLTRDTGGYQDRGPRRTPENPMSVSQTCLIKGELTTGSGQRV